MVFSRGQPVKPLDFTRKDLSGDIKGAFAVQRETDGARVPLGF